MKATIFMFTKRGLTVLVMLLFLTTLIHSQVRIREKVEITPRSQNAQLQLSAPPVPPATTIRLEVSYSGTVSTDPSNGYHTKYFNPVCGEPTGGDWYGEPVTFETPATAGAGAVCTFSMRPITAGRLYIIWYYGSVVLKADSGYFDGYLLGHAFVTFPRYDEMLCGFKLNKPSDICYGETCSLSKQYPIAYTPCEGDGWVNTFGITISITEGLDYGEFLNGSGASLGSSFTCYLDEINAISYIANGEEPDSSGSTVCIRATSGAIVSETSFKVWKQPVLEKFIVTMDPDTIPNYQFSWISLQPIDNFGNPYPLNDATTIALTAEPDSGQFFPAVPTYKQIKENSVVYSAHFQTGPISRYQYYCLCPWCKWNREGDRMGRRDLSYYTVIGGRN